MKITIYNLLATKKLTAFKVHYKARVIAILADGAKYYFTLSGVNIFKVDIKDDFVTRIDLEWLTVKRAEKLTFNKNVFIRALGAYFYKGDTIIPWIAMNDEDGLVAYCAALNSTYTHDALRRHPHPAVRSVVVQASERYHYYLIHDDDARIRARVLASSTKYHKDHIHDENIQIAIIILRDSPKFEAFYADTKSVLVASYRDYVLDNNTYLDRYLSLAKRIAAETTKERFKILEYNPKEEISTSDVN